jgi:hypothetical protein
MRVQELAEGRWGRGHFLEWPEIFCRDARAPPNSGNPREQPLGPPPPFFADKVPFGEHCMRRDYYLSIFWHAPYARLGSPYLFYEGFQGVF